MGKLEQIIKELKRIRINSFLNTYLNQSTESQFVGKEINLLRHLQDLNAGELISELATPKITEVELDSKTKEFLNKIIYQKIYLLQNDIAKVVNEITLNNMRGKKFIKYKVSNQKEKLELLFNKKVLTTNIIKSLDDEAKEVIQDTKNIFLNPKRNPNRIRSWANYPMNITVMVPEKYKEVGPYLIMIKEVKTHSRIAKKVTREIYQEFILRYFNNENTDLLTSDGKIKDLSGIQALFLDNHDYKNDILSINHNNNLELDSKIGINHHDRNDGYKATHIKTKYNKQIDNPFLEKKDEFEIQLIHLSNFIQKEIGEYNQNIYQQRQDQFLDPEFIEKLKKDRNYSKAKKFIEKDHERREQLEKSRSLILDILTYHHNI